MIYQAQLYNQQTNTVEYYTIDEATSYKEASSIAESQYPQLKLLAVICTKN